jgi:hypothetical protein
LAIIHGELDPTDANSHERADLEELAVDVTASGIGSATKQDFGTFRWQQTV